jgi:hypothetical protein
MAKTNSGRTRAASMSKAKAKSKVKTSGRESNAVTSRRTGKLADQRSPRVAKVDETYVGETDATVPVQPRKRSGVPDHPDTAAALDQRRQIVGTDDPKTRTSRGNRGGR